MIMIRIFTTLHFYVVLLNLGVKGWRSHLRMGFFRAKPALDSTDFVREQHGNQVAMFSMWANEFLVQHTTQGSWDSGSACRTPRRTVLCCTGNAALPEKSPDSTDNAARISIVEDEGHKEIIVPLLWEAILARRKVMEIGKYNNNLSRIRRTTRVGHDYWKPHRKSRTPYLDSLVTMIKQWMFWKRCNQLYVLKIGLCNCKQLKNAYPDCRVLSRSDEYWTIPWVVGFAVVRRDNTKDREILQFLQEYSHHRMTQSGSKGG